MRIFVHKEGDSEFNNFILPPSQDSGQDVLYSNCVFLLLDKEWVLFTNLNLSPLSSIVNMYSSSNCLLQYPMKSSIKLLINHYFPHYVVFCTNITSVNIRHMTAILPYLPCLVYTVHQLNIGLFIRIYFIILNL